MINDISAFNLENTENPPSQSKKVSFIFDKKNNIKSNKSTSNHSSYLIMDDKEKHINKILKQASYDIINTNYQISRENNYFKQKTPSNLSGSKILNSAKR